MAYEKFGDDPQEGEYLVNAGWVYDSNFTRWKKMDSWGTKVIYTDSDDVWKRLVENYKVEPEVKDEMIRDEIKKAWGYSHPRKPKGDLDDFYPHNHD